MLTFVLMDLFNQNGNQAAYSLSEFARKVEETIAFNFNQAYWIRAEMARLNFYPESGHCYPDLVERENNKLKVQMRGIIWAGDFERIALQFRKVAREEPGDGMQVMIRASLRFHPLYGLSLQIHDIDPAYTLGQLAREKMETVLRLKEEGLFERNRELELPLLPKRLAVISVKTSKGFSDFIRILEQDPPHFRFILTLFPAILQGDAAVESILSQLRVILHYRDYFDAVAIIRGGGGEVGLSCYDNYRLARAVAEFPLPVLTGIGHSTNETVVEMVAHVSKITPTDVAYFLLNRFEEFEARVNGAAELMKEMVIARLERENARLSGLAGSARSFASQVLSAESRHLLHVFRELSRGSQFSVGKEKSQVGNRVAMLRLSSNHLVRLAVADLGLLERKIHLLDPANTLKRGYSITYANGLPLTDADSLSPGDEISTRLFRGDLKSIVKSKNNR